MTLSDFRALCTSVKQCGSGFTAQCPAHDDKHNSLKVDEENSKILIHCHAGCTPEQVIQAMDLTMTDLLTGPPRLKKSQSAGPIVKTYDYTLNGTLIFQVCRHEPKSFSQRHPDGNGGWVSNLNGIDPRPMYHHDELVDAISQGKTVFLCEGEKDVDNLRALGLTATTNACGASGWRAEYTATLEPAARIAILQDNDAAGIKRSKKLCALFGNRARVLQLPGLRPHGDVSDWIEDGGTKEQLEHYTDQVFAAEPATEQDPFVILGCSGSKVYVGIRHEHLYTTYAVDPGFLPESVLTWIAPREWWEVQFPGEKGVAWSEARNWFQRQAQSKGMFDKGNIRGRGAWHDGKDIVLHCGTHLWLRGKPWKLSEWESTYFYEQAPAIDVTLNDAPLTTAKAGDLIKLCTMFSWQNPAYGYLFAGWLAIAPICGVLEWRPHLWITGASGSGKSWINSEVIKPILGGYALRVQSSVTEAGIRQIIGRDARPVLFDEAEAEGERAGERVQRILELARMASSEDGGAIIKGSAHGDPVTFCIRSVFAFSSVGVQLKLKADQSRTTVLGLEHFPAETKDERFKAIKDLTRSLLTPEFASAFIERSVKMAGVIRESSHILSDTITDLYGNRRMGDQLGVIAAGLYSLMGEHVIELAQARELAKVIVPQDVVVEQEDTDELYCLHILLERLIRVEFVEHEHVQQRERTIREIILETINPTDFRTAQSCRDALARIGIRAIQNGVFISNKHTGLAQIYRGTQFEQRWPMFLRRLDGVKSDQQRLNGKRPMGVTVPWTYIESSEREEPLPEYEDAF